jgi:CRISPR-associated endoribonuclease Cas6
MRITLILKSLKDISQKDTLAKYYSSLHGWVYKQKLANSVFSSLHEKKGYKYFCLSNLIGVKNNKVRENYAYKIIISSPNKELINVIKNNLKEGEIINLGEYSFELMRFYDYNIKLDNFSVIETPTIIVVTEHVNGKMKAWDFMKKDEKEKYLYLLRRNLIKKYNSFNGSKIDENYDLWNNVIIEPILKGKYSIYCEPLNFKFIGNKLRFKLGYLDEVQKKVFNHCFEAGFGGYCSYGMGFVMEKR